VTYTQLALVGVVAVVLLDVVVLRTRLVTRRVFWVAYAIVAVFQLITNGVLTGFGIVRYDGDAIMGSSTPTDVAPPFLGDGRIAFAPLEDLLFGFVLILLTQALWVWLGRRGVERTPYSGPPRVRLPGDRSASSRDD
jgi:hypothetical protein